MNERVESIGDLVRLRSRMRESLEFWGVAASDCADFVLCVHEATVAALAHADPSSTGVVVTWDKHDQPRTELVAGVRVVGSTPIDLHGDALRADIVNRLSDRVRVHRLIGGAAVEIRLTVAPSASADWWRSQPDPGAT